MKPLNPKETLNKAFLKVKLNRSEIEQFKENLIQLIDDSSQNQDQHEEFHKNLVSTFLNKTYYEGKHFVNIHNRQDLVIHNDKAAKSSVGVIIEAKRPENKNEMIKTDKLNVKAFQELVLYYLRERISHKNLEVKHLIVTNVSEWFIFDAQVFEKGFAQNKKLVKQFEDFEAGRLSGKSTDYFYKEIAEPFIAELENEIAFTHFDLKNYNKPLRNQDKKDDKKLIALYKLLSAEHLLKLPFANDSNSLDKKFYSELLHIIGLAETKKGGKKIIERSKEGERNAGSLLENAIIQLDSLDKMSRLENRSQYGNTNEECLFNVGLELAITWVNRILFLKLLEAQLISYHKGNRDYAFLNFDKINNYDDLNSLFFQVLAKKQEDRSEDVKQAFAYVPYLNSSLFEPNEMEHNTLFISNLRDNRTLPILSNTVLKDDKGKKRKGELNGLQYLFEFLESYDFSSEGAEDIQEDNKTLINASVLGSIFEKINGYKDGSFFTPGFITMYMCRETIRRGVVQKFNETKGWTCQNLDDIYDKIEDRGEANDIINSLKICDPAVGSGHFLVSALNEMIAIKNDLKILQDRNGRRLKEYQFEVENDELIITDDNGELFEYHYTNKESQRVQEAIFHEKQTLIENCLFGVDINPNSVKICRLRLWIELLKNAYYKNPLSTGEGTRGEVETLETLPNIDINIKCGNSLISRFGLDVDIKKALKQSKWTIDGYKIAVDAYRNAQNKEEKHAMERLINDIKNDFRSEISKNDPKVKKLYKLQGEFSKLTTQQSLFDMAAKEKKVWNKKLNKLSAESKKLEKAIEEIRHNKIYENAFEWRFEFPEVLNDDGDFVGFDVVIGNPPYIRQEEFKEIKPYLQSRFGTYAGMADLYVYFIELGLQNLKKDGEFTFIIPNKWMRAGYGLKLRNFLKDRQLHSILDFGDLQVFEEATTYPCILSLAKSQATESFIGVNFETLDFPTGIWSEIKERAFDIKIDLLEENGWSLIASENQNLLFKIKSKGIPLNEYVKGEIYRGVLTGLNEAFVIDEATKEKLIAEDSRSAEVIKPFLAGRDIKRYVNPHSLKHLVLLKSGDTKSWFGDLSESQAWEGLKKRYPAICVYLSDYKERGKKRYDKGHYWWELRACDYYQEFEKNKIIIPAIVKSASYAFDTNGIYGNDKTSIIPTDDLSLLGLLNSSLIDFYLKSIASTKQNGYFEYKPVYVSQLPIKGMSESEKQIIVAKVNQILSLKKENPSADTSALETEIDQLVYQLYDLTAEEIALVEAAV